MEKERKRERARKEETGMVRERRGGKEVGRGREEREQGC
jgi:hypothetical protein